MSRGLSNCNPGNIRQSKVRYKGEVQPSRDPAFKQFESLPGAIGPSSCCCILTGSVTACGPSAG